ncbi:MAG TPA: phosphoribosylamine--glycine ligase [Candidatus Limnocylindrales bacterium]|nr:phosphoribosylamine--glycine ligase [Candidatus Limnocylindrales bacterium]
MEGPRVLVVGQGGREHAIVCAMHDSPQHPHVLVAPGSAGMADLAERVPLAATDVPGISAWARRNSIDLAIIGPDAAVAMGMADSLRALGIDVLAPGAAGALLEASKRHAKERLRALGLPTARSAVATTPEEAQTAADAMGYPAVIKADGLAAGKGVVIAETRESAAATIDAWMRRRALGDAGATLVIEEYLRGEEASLLVLSDGERWMLFPAARDHKRLEDGDRGPNTGGMGACAPARAPRPEEAIAIGKRIVDPVLRALREEGSPYRGILYVGLMLTAEGPAVLEFNARFGDPEAQVVLPLLAEDPFPLFRAAARGSLPADRHATFIAHQGAAVCVVLASRGYPERPETGTPIDGLDGPWPHGINIFHSGVERRGGRWVTAGGRVVGVTARSETLESARDAAYGAASRIRFGGMRYRKDIACQPPQAGKGAP